MAEDCQSFIAADPPFPRPPWNRPALPRVGYRIGTYPEFVEALMRHVNTAVELRAWTHREPDDPAVAILHGAAIVADILTFYQEHYANEAYLRTARWRESVSDLVRLLGYRLTPGVGGRGTFAFEVRGTQPVEIPAGFPLKADLKDREAPAEFETADDLTAYPHLSRFRLYRPRNYAASIWSGTTQVEIESVNNQSTRAAIDGLKLKAGDQLLLIPAEPGWTTSGAALSEQGAPQTLKVKSVKQVLDRTVVEFETLFATSWTSPVTAYRLGRSFRHFGHNAPPVTIYNSHDSDGKIDGAYDYNTAFYRHVRRNHSCTNSSCSIGLNSYVIPLDQEVNDLPEYARVAVRTLVRNGESSPDVFAVTVVKRILSTRSATIGFGSLTGPSTLLSLESALLRQDGLPDVVSDVRDYQIQELKSPPIKLRPVATGSSGAFPDGHEALCFFGTVEEVKPLAGRRMVLEHDDGRTVELSCTNVASDFWTSAGADAQMWPLSFDRKPAPFTRGDFDETTPTVAALGNLADATQGKAERETILGNGDGRARFQTFELPKAPLTYLLSSGATPPQVPELEVRVGGRLWKRVDSFYGRGPEEEVYIVREDAAGKSFVQFGDGDTGARLPSGLRNVTARYRTGVGANGPIKPGAKPSGGRRIEGLDTIALPGVVAGGAEAEAADRAREAAPGKIQGLGRLVSLRDYETEVLSIPGITRAAAAWALTDNVPTLTLTVLLEAGREAEFQAIKDTIAAFDHCRGPNRFPVHVVQAYLRYAFVDVVYSPDPALLPETVEKGMKAALGLAGDADHARTGLFGLYRRRLGEKEYASRIEGVLQQCEGVAWCKVTALGLFSASATDPKVLTLPASPRALAAQLSCGSNRLLQLYPTHLTLTATTAAPGVCS